MTEKPYESGPHWRFFIHYFRHFLRSLKIVTYVILTLTCIAGGEVNKIQLSSFRLLLAHLSSFRLIQTHLSSFQLINYWYKFYLKESTFRGMWFSLIYIRGFFPRKLTQFFNNPNIDGTWLIPGHLGLFEPISAYLGSFRLIWGHLTTIMLIWVYASLVKVLFKLIIIWRRLCRWGACL